MPTSHLLTAKPDLQIESMDYTLEGKEYTELFIASGCLGDNTSEWAAKFGTWPDGTPVMRKKHWAKWLTLRICHDGETSEIEVVTNG